MKMLLSLIALAVLVAPVSAGTMVIDTTTPGGEIASATGVTSYTKLFDTRADGNVIRGNTFVTADNATGTQWSMTSLSLRKDSAQTYNGDTLTLWVFKGTTDDWNAGDGIADGDLFDGTTVESLLIDGETATLTGAVADSDFMHFNLAAPLIMEENASYGFVFRYTQGAGAVDVRIDMGVAIPGGMQLQIENTYNKSAGGATTFYASGDAVVPEPATMSLLALGGVAMLKRRK